MEARRQALMGDPGLYDPEMLGRDRRSGHIKRYPVGSTFKNRSICCAAGVHAQKQAGIHGDHSGAYSICMSDGYEDDEDRGDFFVYTGTGGQGDDNPFATGRQTKDQSFDHPHNLTLAKSVQTQRPVRVIRGPNPKSPFAPAAGYRYDGLYIVERAYEAKGRSGYIVCKYDLRRVPGQAPLPGTIPVLF